MASEKEQRVLSKNQIIRDVYCEAMPFLFTKSGGGGEIRMTESVLWFKIYMALFLVILKNTESKLNYYNYWQLVKKKMKHIDYDDN
jgi:hypothetical protein